MACTYVNQAWKSHRVREFKFPLEVGATTAEWSALQAKRTAEVRRGSRATPRLRAEGRRGTGCAAAPGGLIFPTLNHDHENNSCAELVQA